MGNTLIKVACTDQTLSVIENPLVAAGGIKEDVVEFQFCSLWDGFTKTAVFYRDKDNVYHVALDLNDKAIVPKEVLTTEGTVYFGVYGVSGEVTRTSEVLRYKVKEGAIIEGTTPADPIPDIYTQILSKVASVESKVTSVESNIETLESKVTSVESNIETLESKVTSVESNIETLESKVTSVESNIETLESKVGTTTLTTTAQTLTGAVNEVKSNVDGIQIGGRNLLTQTNQGATGWDWSMQIGGVTFSDIVDSGVKACKVVRDAVEQSGWNVVTFAISQQAYSLLTPNTKYIISMDYKSSVAVSSYAISFGIKTSSGQKPACSDKYYASAITADTWTHVVVQITTVANIPVYDTQCLYINGIPATVNSTHIFKNLKIEKGNKSTDWTPSPEDFDAKIAALEARIAALEGS